ncbi:MAG: hypothetical protein CVT78_09280 [Alphaproteobacteria bacterium HGW-Alphaproteobacteria-17]|nr:MAG: hypothetical protein CVT78_09280 [Alphaproteobacteria bacterium HGW-Alphaproteobacteria-17]
MTTVQLWIPDQVRDDEESIVLPVAKRWGGGPSAKRMVEGRASRQSPSVSPSDCHLPIAARQGGVMAANEISA